MSVLEVAAVLAAGLAGGSINAVVGSGTLITFPVLVAIGVPPLTANVSNCIGMVPGTVSAAYGYRHELRGRRALVLRLAVGSAIGGATGAVLLLVLPPGAFEAIVPVLILLGVALVAAQPRLSAWAARRAEQQVAPSGLSEIVPTSAWVWPVVLLVGVYGGYFGAAQGVLLLAVLGIGVQQSLQQSNAVKNVLSGVANSTSGAMFVVLADVDWLVAGLIGLGSVIGGVLGARFGRRLPAPVLRAVIIFVGLVAVTVFLLRRL